MASSSLKTASFPRLRPCELPRVPDARRRARPPSWRRRLSNTGAQRCHFPTKIGQLTALTHLRVPPASPTPGAAGDRPSPSQGAPRERDPRPAPDRDRPAQEAEVPANSPRVPDRRGARPRRRRSLWKNWIGGTIPSEIGLLTALTFLRVPPASPTPGAARDRPSTSQEPQRQPARRPDPAPDRPAHGADVPASSPRVPDARRAARPPLGVAGTSQAATTRSPARSRPSFAASQLARPTLATTSSRRAARATVAICSALRVSRSLTSPTIP